MNKETVQDFNWLTDNSRKFLGAGYLTGDQTPDLANAASASVIVA